MHAHTRQWHTKKSKHSEWTKWDEAKSDRLNLWAAPVIVQVRVYEATQYYYYYRAVLAILPLTSDQIRAQVWPNGVREERGQFLQAVCQPSPASSVKALDRCPMSDDQLHFDTGGSAVQVCSNVCVSVWLSCSLLTGGSGSVIGWKARSRDCEADICQQTRLSSSNISTNYR